MINSIKNYYYLTRLDRPIGTFLLLWPTLIALLFAGDGLIKTDLLIIFCLGTLFMRSAGCVINDYFDQDFDKRVLRTSMRPIAAGLVSNKEALVLFILLIFMSFLLLLFLNEKSLQIASCLILIVILYPLAKRFFKVPQFILGLAFSGGIPMAYAATLNELPASSFLLFIGNYLWVIAYDTSYAMTDKRDDLSIGIGSSAIYFQGKEKIIIRLGSLSFMLIVFLLGLEEEINFFFYIGFFITSLYVIYLFNSTDFKKEDSCLKFFKRNNWIGVLLFLTLITGLN